MCNLCVPMWTNILLLQFVDLICPPIETYEINFVIITIKVGPDQYFINAISRSDL